MRVTLRSALAAVSAAVILAACAAPPRAPAPIERGGSAPRGAAAQGCTGSVTVQRGDTLYSIARQCRVNVSELAAENGLAQPYTLRPGQVLRVPGPATYTVRRGDNLYRIALAHGMSTEEVAQLNGLRRPYTIYPGQELQVRGQARTQVARAPSQSPGAEPAPQRSGGWSSPPPAPAGGPDFQWPLRGEVINTFGPSSEGRLDGIRIAARLGEPVRAAAPGEVVYVGNELQGYGELVLIRHSDNWVTAYGLNSTLRVSVGQQVQAGDHIADAGASGPLTRPALHFEIRRGINPVDPMQRLPAR